jgi:hypothetical protein
MTIYPPHPKFKILLYNNIIMNEKVEIYKFERQEIDENRYKEQKIINDIEYIQEYKTGNIYSCSSDNISGQIIFNSLVVVKKNTKTITRTSTCTFITNNGTLIFDVSYTEDYSLTPLFAPPDDTIIKTIPTFKKGYYEKFKKIEVLILFTKSLGTRIVTIILHE